MTEEAVFPSWTPLSIEKDGFDTKGYFGEVFVLNSAPGQKAQAVKILPIMPNKSDADEFAVDTPEDPNVEVEIIKNVKKLKEEKVVAGAPRRMTKVRYVDPLSQHGKAEEQLYKRLTILKTFKNENILRFRGFQDDGESFWQISDYNPSRSVLDHQRWLGRALKEDETCTVTCGVLKALAYLRYRRIVHGNIKASNIMFNIENGEGILSDFRLPGYQRFDELAKPESSLYYMAPELLLTQGKEASEKSDLWALGATICELMSRFPPYNEMTREEVESEMRKTPFKRPNPPSIALDHCKDFLATCFMVPASKRPTAELLMPHPWVCRGLSSGLSHLELTGTLLSDWQQTTLIGVYAPTDTPIPGADTSRPIYKHWENKVYIFYFESTASWQIAEMKDLGRPRAVLYVQDDVRWPQLIGATWKGWSKKLNKWAPVEDASLDVFYTAED